MNITNVIKEQIEELEQRLQNAVYEYTYASNGLRALNQLTNKLREEVENEHDNDTAPRVATEKQA